MNLQLFHKVLNKVKNRKHKDLDDTITYRELFNVFAEMDYIERRKVEREIKFFNDIENEALDPNQ